MSLHLRRFVGQEEGVTALFLFLNQKSQSTIWKVEKTNYIKMNDDLIRLLKDKKKEKPTSRIAIIIEDKDDVVKIYNLLKDLREKYKLFNYRHLLSRKWEWDEDLSGCLMEFHNYINEIKTHNEDAYYILVLEDSNDIISYTSSDKEKHGTKDKPISNNGIHFFHAKQVLDEEEYYKKALNQSINKLKTIINE